ncbi:hypothetical protein ACLB2K_076670 [Fragaria x ananassa]
MVRIRKNLKVSPLQFFPDVAPEDLQPHICKLNQSPWDSSSCPFDLDSSSSPLQFQGEEGFIGNGSLGDSIAAVESVASPMDIDKAEVAAGDVSDNVDKVFARCQRTDGRSWQCKKEAKEGFLFCDHHLRRSSAGNNNVNSNGNILPSNFVGSKKDTAVQAKTLAGTRRGRPKAVKKGPNAANPYEFYYYSGFGPKWGRKRGKKGQLVGEEEEEDEENEEASNVEAAAENVAASASSSSVNTDPQPSSPHNVDNGGQLDYMEDDFDDEDGSDEEGGLRRMRRPVKARSLMSIINVKAQE